MSKFSHEQALALGFAPREIARALEPLAQEMAGAVELGQLRRDSHRTRLVALSDLLIPPTVNLELPKEILRSLNILERTIQLKLMRLSPSDVRIRVNSEMEGIIRQSRADAAEQLFLGLEFSPPATEVPLVESPLASVRRTNEPRLNWQYENHREWSAGDGGPGGIVDYWRNSTLAQIEQELPRVYQGAIQTVLDKQYACLEFETASSKISLTSDLWKDVSIHWDSDKNEIVMVYQNERVRWTPGSLQNLAELGFLGERVPAPVNPRIRSHGFGRLPGEDTALIGALYRLQQLMDTLRAIREQILNDMNKPDFRRLREVIKETAKWHQQFGESCAGLTESLVGQELFGPVYRDLLWAGTAWRSDFWANRQEQSTWNPLAPTLAQALKLRRFRSGFFSREIPLLLAVILGSGGSIAAAEAGYFDGVVRFGAHAVNFALALGKALGPVGSGIRDVNVAEISDRLGVDSLAGTNRTPIYEVSGSGFPGVVELASNEDLKGHLQPYDIAPQDNENSVQMTSVAVHHPVGGLIPFGQPRGMRVTGSLWGTTADFEARRLVQGVDFALLQTGRGLPVIRLAPALANRSVVLKGKFVWHANRYTTNLPLSSEGILSYVVDLHEIGASELATRLDQLVQDKESAGGIVFESDLRQVLHESLHYTYAPPLHGPTVPQGHPLYELSAFVLDNGELHVQCNGARAACTDIFKRSLEPLDMFEVGSTILLNTATTGPNGSVYVLGNLHTDTYRRIRGDSFAAEDYFDATPSATDIMVAPKLTEWQVWKKKAWDQLGALFAGAKAPTGQKAVTQEPVFLQKLRNGDATPPVAVATAESSASAEAELSVENRLQLNALHSQERSIEAATTRVSFPKPTASVEDRASLPSRTPAVATEPLPRKQWFIEVPVVDPDPDVVLWLKKLRDQYISSSAVVTLQRRQPNEPSLPTYFVARVLKAALEYYEGKLDLGGYSKLLQSCVPLAEADSVRIRNATDIAGAIERVRDSLLNKMLRLQASLSHATLEAQWPGLGTPLEAAFIVQPLKVLAKKSQAFNRRLKGELMEVPAPNFCFQQVADFGALK